MWNIVYILFELGKIILWAVLLFSRRQNVHIQLLFFLTHFLKPPKIKLFRKVLIKKVKDCFSLLWEQIFWEKLNEKVSRKLLSVEIAKLLNSIFYSNFLLFVPKILFLWKLIVIENSKQLFVMQCNSSDCASGKWKCGNSNGESVISRP